MIITMDAQKPHKETSFLLLDKPDDKRNCS